jgi:hypothetical protein
MMALSQYDSSVLGREYRKQTSWSTLRNLYVVEIVGRRLGQGSVVVVGKSDLLARGPCPPPSKHCNERVLLCFDTLVLNDLD